VSREKYDKEVEKRIKFESQYYALLGENGGLRNAIERIELLVSKRNK